MTILFIFDLDNTHLDPKQKNITWIGSEQRWVTFYRELVKKASDKGQKVLFAVVTTKKIFDDICVAAATAFKEFLQPGCPDMYANVMNEPYILVNQAGTVKYERLSKSPDSFMPSDKVRARNHSHFHIITGWNKNNAILQIANYHRIPPQNIMVLDDLPEVRDHAKVAGMHTVSFHYFDPRNINFYRTEPRSLPKVLTKIEQEIRDTFEKILQVQQNNPSSSDNAQTPFSTEDTNQFMEEIIYKLIEAQKSNPPILLSQSAAREEPSMTLTPATAQDKPSEKKMNP